MENDNIKFQNSRIYKLYLGHFFNSKILTFLFVIFIFTFSFLHFSKAQTSPQFLVSWQAQSYVPSWYQGKILPVYKGPMEISFELIDNGKLADLSQTKIRWYVDDKLIKNEADGLGIKSLKFNIPDYAGYETAVRIAVVDYKSGGLLDKIITIPVVGPEAVINAPYPDGKIRTGSSIFNLIPFFFNMADISNLSVDWSVNDQKPEGTSSPYLLNLNIGLDTPKDTPINISVSVKNLLNDLEFASKNIQLQIK